MVNVFNFSVYEWFRDRKTSTYPFFLTNNLYNLAPTVTSPLLSLHFTSVPFTFVLFYRHTYYHTF